MNDWYFGCDRFKNISDFIDRTQKLIIVVLKFNFKNVYQMYKLIIS